jgi:hypothetical protein
MRAREFLHGPDCLETEQRFDEFLPGEELFHDAFE